MAEITLLMAFRGQPGFRKQLWLPAALVDLLPLTIVQEGSPCLESIG